MRTIYKYSLDKEDEYFTLRIPSDFNILKVGIQDDKPVLWCMVDPSNDNVDIDFYVASTGESLPRNCTIDNYVDSFQAGSFVGHLFKL